MKKITLISFLLLSMGVYSQFEIEKTFKVPIRTSSENINIEVDNTSHQPRVKEDRTYYWFKNREVHFTKGAYAGKLLHGSYESFYKSNQLKERGEFKFGLKDGLWVEWYENGEIKSETNWRNGVLEGTKKIYAQDGAVEIHDYKHGEIVEEERKVEEQRVESDTISPKVDSTIVEPPKVFKFKKQKEEVENSDKNI